VGSVVDPAELEFDGDRDGEGEVIRLGDGGVGRIL
jgi:hypothetical protein